MRRRPRKGIKKMKLVSHKDMFELRQEKPHWELRKSLVDRMVGTSDRARLMRDIDRARQHRIRMHSVDRSSIDPQIQLKEPFEIEEEDSQNREKIKGKFTKNPARKSFGSTDTFIEVESGGPFGFATLRFKVDKEKIAHLEPETIVVAVWKEKIKRFQVVPQSGYNKDLGYAYAQISSPGIYTAVGLPKDPRIQTTIQLISSMKQWMPLNDRFNFNKKICQVILCDHQMEEAVAKFVKTGKGLEHLGFSPSDFTDGLGQRNICEMCLDSFGDSSEGSVEVDIVDVIDPPPIIIRPLPPFWWWRHCSRWMNIGPDNVPGRMSALAIHPTDGNIVYAGGAAGGVFKTSNAGTYWYPQWSDQLSLAIGGLAIAPSNPNVIYAATGEWEGNVGAANNHFPGFGVYRSTDGGIDWDLLAPIPSRNTAAVAIDPTNPNRVFVAGDVSLHRTTNGGMSWDLTSGNTNGIFDGIISDVVIDSNDVNRIYIGVHNSGVWRSLDGGNTWALLTNGIATNASANSPKIALGRNGAHGSNFVAVKMARRVFTSTDGGNIFTEQSNCDINWAPFYPWANVIAVDPQNESILFGGHASIYRSTDGGANWTQVGGYGVPPVHPDQQAIVFDPTNHDHIYLATDGGIYESLDNGQTWTAKSSGLVTTQCWTVGISHTPTLAYGITTQDNACYEWSGGYSFSQILGPEGGWIEYDPQDSNKIYADTWFAQLMKSTNGGTNWNNLGIDTDNGNTESLSIAHTNTDWLLVIKSNGRVARSTNGGTTWSETLNVPGVIISAVQFAPSTGNHAYAASTLGRVWHSNDGGSTWNELPNAGLPAARVHDIEVDWNNPYRVYLAFGALGIRQLWRGDIDVANNATWFDISGALPATSLPDLALTGLALHPYQDETVYVSNILGVYRSVDGGESWAPFDEGLPNSFVSDLDIRKYDRTLYVSTMGRGVYRRYI